MFDLINDFIGKKCEIKTLEAEYTGVIEKVEENWIVVLDSWYDTKVIVNLEYVTGIRLCKEKTKKSRKSEIETE